MDAALEEMLALRKVHDVEVAPLKDPRPGHGDVGKAAGTLWNRRLAMVEGWHESAPEVRHLRKCVRLTALVDHGDGGSLLDRQLVRFEVPARIRGSAVCRIDQLVQRRLETQTETIQCDVVAEPPTFLPHRRVERNRVTLVQWHHLRDRRRGIVEAKAKSRLIVSDRMGRAD